jgi:tetratricopeptide (TPR) repeat protein
MTTGLRCGTENQKAKEYFESGNFGLQINKLTEARKLFYAAVQTDSLFCDAWDNLSIVCRRLGQYEDAFAASLHSLVIDSTNGVAWANCGYASFLAGDIYRALTSFNHAQRIIPDDPEGYYGKSMILYSIDSIEQARKNILKAKELYAIKGMKIGKEVDLLHGFIEYKYGLLNNAQLLFQKVYSDNRENAELNYYLGQCILINENDTRKAQKYIYRAKILGYVLNDKLMINK